MNYILGILVLAAVGCVIFWKEKKRWPWEKK
jgi:hypothetical protein